MRCFQGTNEGQDGERPQRHQCRVLVELEAEEIVERNERQEERYRRALRAVDPLPRQLEREINSGRDGEHCKHDVRPIGLRKQHEPAANDPGKKRRVLWIAKCGLMGPNHHFRHVGIDVLAGLGDDAVGRPNHGVKQNKAEDGRPAPRWIAQHVDESAKPINESAMEPSANRSGNCHLVRRRDTNHHGGKRPRHARKDRKPQ